MFETEQYTIVPPFLLPMVPKLENPLGLDPFLFEDALGVSGPSAFASLYELGKPQKGQAIYISLRAGESVKSWVN